MDYHTVLPGTSRAVHRGSETMRKVYLSDLLGVGQYSSLDGRMSDAIISNGKDPPAMLACPACKNAMKDPALLPCLHSACRDCLIRINRQNESRGVITCPECEELVDIPEGGVTAFPTNYFLKGLLSVFLAKTAKDIRCRICELQDKDKFATFKCLNCTDFLCEECAKAHNLTRMTFEHCVRPLSELTDGKSDREMRDKQMIMCGEHEGEVIKYFCETCFLPICRECQLEVHVGHTCASAKDSSVSRRSAILNMVQGVQQKAAALLKAEGSVKVTEADIDKREQDLKEGVEKTVKKLIDQIQKEKSEILQGLQQTMEQQRQICSSKRESINDAHNVMQGNIKFCEEVLKNGKDVELLYLDYFIRQRLITLQSKSTGSYLLKWTPPDVKFRNVFLTVDRIGLFDLTVAKEFNRKPDPSIKFGSRHVAGLHLVKRINMTVPREDQFECRATGLACLYGDHIVVGDQENRKIKVFTRLGNYVETVANFKSSSLAVCGDVIGATDHMSLNLYSNDRSGKKKISLESTGSSYPMTSLNDQYLILAKNKTVVFQLYDLRGDLCHDIAPEKGSKIRNPVFIAANSKGHLIVSDWMSNCLIIMDQSGHTLKEFKLKSKQSSTGWLPGSLCCDQFDNIYVSDFSRSRIIVLNPLGDFMFEYSTRADNLDRPRCMACDGNGYILISGKGGYLNVYACQYV